MIQEKLKSMNDYENKINSKLKNCKNDLKNRLTSPQINIFENLNHVLTLFMQNIEPDHINTEDIVSSSYKDIKINIRRSIKQEFMIFYD